MTRQRALTTEATESGQRLARLRKAAGLSQMQLAQVTGIPQRTLSFYEREAEAIPSKHVPTLALALQVSVEEVLGLATAGAQKKRGPQSQLEKQLALVRQLPRAQQEFVVQFLDTFLKSAEKV